MDYEQRCIEYDEYLSSLPVLPCEGWKPEVGKEYVKGVDFYLHDTTPPHKVVAVLLPAAPQGETTYCETCGPTDRCAEFQQEGSCAYVITRKLFAPVSTQLPEIDHPEEGAAYLQPAHAAVTDEGDGEFMQYVKNSRNELVDFISAFEWRTDLRTAIDSLLICFDQMADRLKSPTYPAEFVEWVEGSEWCFWQGQGWRKLTAKGIYLSTTELYQEWKRIQSQSK